MTAKEVTECRASLGAVQWVAVQTQPLACARCNLLLTDLTTDPKMSVAQEIQEIIRELRKSATVLNFFKLPGVSSWFDLVVVGLGDQAHLNRPKCSSTGGMLIFLRGRAICRGAPNPMILVHWKSWKLKRKSIGTNDAEVQALVETEDWTRLLWTDINGAGAHDNSRNLLEASLDEVQNVPGLLGTDSKGGYDSMIVNESPPLGLSHTRAALQAFKLKESLPRCATKLVWLASDWNLSDALTKKKWECRESLDFSWRAECGCFDLIHKSLDLLGRKDRALRSNLAQRHRGRRCLELTRILGSCNTPIPFVSVTMSSIHLTPYHAQGPLEPVAWPVTRL